MDEIILINEIIVNENGIAAGGTIATACVELAMKYGGSNSLHAISIVKDCVLAMNGM